MFRIIPLIHLLQFVINAGIISALDEGRFLWAQKNVDNITNSGKRIRSGRWTRSIFNWLHSPLINSIQEAFVIDSVYGNLAPVTKCMKRSVNKSQDDLIMEESFENEFFLWEDNEGNPLEFGLKQIQEVKPYYQLGKNNIYRRSSSKSLWEEPLFYEDNRDVREVDINHLSYHEQLKLNDILKNKMDSIKNIFHTQTTKNHSIYYTLEPPSNLHESVMQNKFNNDYFKRKSNPKNLHVLINNGYRYSDRKKSGELDSSTAVIYINQIRNTSAIDSNFNITSSNILKQSSNENVYHKDELSVKMTTPLIDQVNSKDPPYRFELLNFHKANFKEDGPEYFWSNEINDNHKRDPSKFTDIHKSKSKNHINHRNLRTLHHRFLKHRRKGKKKHLKSRYPDGRSYQYELFGTNVKSPH